MLLHYRNSRLHAVIGWTTFSLTELQKLQNVLSRVSAKIAGSLVKATD